MYIRASYIAEIQKLLNKSNTLLVVGARQVGKTTLLKQFLDTQNLEEKLMINCENRSLRPFDTRDEMINWFLIQHNIDITQSGIIILDEIQARKEAELFIKVRHDDDEISCKLIATGSRFLGEVRAGSTLVGRGERLHIFPFSFEEFLEAQGKTISGLKNIQYERIKSELAIYMRYGGYPAVVYSKTPQEKVEVLQSLIHTWIDKDIGYFLNKEYTGSFYKALQHISLNIGNIYKEDPLCAHIGLSKSVVKNMVSFLVESYIGYNVIPFYTDKSQEYNKHSEYFLGDTGWINALRTQRYGDDSHDGKLVENFVATQCLKLKTATTYYYKKKSGTEIDFIIELWDGSLIPIEVKSGNKTTTPKAFGPFFEKYGSRCAYGIVTTQSIQDQKQIGNMSIHYIPYWRLLEFIAGQ